MTTSLVKGFTQDSRSWWGKEDLKHAPYRDAVTFGLYSPNGVSTAGEITVKWETLDGKIVPNMSVFSDAWGTLAQFHDLFIFLGKHANEDPSPEVFCSYLLQCGFIDLTATKR